MNKYLISFLATAAVVVFPAHSALKAADAKRFSQIGMELGLQVNPKSHAQIYMDAKRAGRDRDRAFYISRGILPIGGGVYAAGPAPAAFGFPIDYNDDASLDAASILILKHYHIDVDDVWKLATIHLLKTNRRIPSEAEIRAEYDRRLTPYIRAQNLFKARLSALNLEEARRESEELINSISADALSSRTVKDSADAVAALGFIRQLLQTQIILLKAAPNTSVFKSLAYKRNNVVFATLYSGNPRFQTAASNTTPSMMNILDKEFKELAYFQSKVYYETLIKKSSYRTALGQIKKDKLFPLIKLLKMGDVNTRPAILNVMLSRLTPDIMRKATGLITSNLPNAHAQAIFHLVLRSKKLNEILEDVDKAKAGKSQEDQRKINAIYSLLEALRSRTTSSTPPRALGFQGKKDSKDVIDAIRDLQRRIISRKEHIRTPNLDQQERAL